MKIKQIVFSLLCIGITSCSSPKNGVSLVESETAAADAIVTETTAKVTTAETVIEPVITTTTIKAIKIEKKDISDEVAYDYETQIVGNDTYGYLEIPIEWEYEEDDHKRPIMAYIDDKGNRIYMKNCDLIGFGITHKDIDELAELYDGSGAFNDAETIKYEIDGYTAYKTTYSRLEAVQPVNYGEEYCTHWIFECEDGVNRSVGFSGSEEFIEMSDNIIKTYHLY